MQGFLGWRLKGVTDFVQSSIDHGLVLCVALIEPVIGALINFMLLQYCRPVTTGLSSTSKG